VARGESISRDLVQELVSRAKHLRFPELFKEIVAGGHRAAAEISREYWRDKVYIALSTATSRADHAPDECAPQIPALGEGSVDAIFKALSKLPGPKGASVVRMNDIKKAPHPSAGYSTAYWRGMTYATIAQALAETIV